MVPVVMNFFSRQSTMHDVGPTVPGTRVVAGIMPVPLVHQHKFSVMQSTMHDVGPTVPGY